MLKLTLQNFIQFMGIFLCKFFNEGQADLKIKKKVTRLWQHFLAYKSSLMRVATSIGTALEVSVPHGSNKLCSISLGEGYPLYLQHGQKMLQIP